MYSLPLHQRYFLTSKALPITISVFPVTNKAFSVAIPACVRYYQPVPIAVFLYPSAVATFANIKLLALSTSAFNPLQCLYRVLPFLRFPLFPNPTQYTQYSLHRLRRQMLRYPLILLRRPLFPFASVATLNICA